MNIADLIAALIPILLQVTPQLVIDITNLIHGNPQTQGETDADYIARLSAQIQATNIEVQQGDATIENG